MDELLETEDSDTQEIFVEYLDKFLYEFFNAQLKESGILIFPETYDDDDLHLQPYLQYIDFLESQKPKAVETPAELLESPIEEAEVQKDVKAVAAALARRRKQFMYTKKHEKAIKRKNPFAQTLRLKHK